MSVEETVPIHLVPSLIQVPRGNESSTTVRLLVHTTMNMVPQAVLVAHICKGYLLTASSPTRPVPPYSLPVDRAAVLPYPSMSPRYYHAYISMYLVIARV